MRIVTLNVNGIRSAARKGLYPWLAAQKADLVCLQEVKAHEADLEPALLAPKGYFGYFHCAEKKGYAGVALYSRVKPDKVITGFGVKEFDAEGRYLEAQFGKLAVVSIYLPSGGVTACRPDRRLSAAAPASRKRRRYSAGEAPK